MKKHVLTLSLMLVLPGIASADRAEVAATANAGTRAPARAAASAGADDVETLKARRELDDLRRQIGELSRRMGELSVRLGEVGPRAYALRYLNEPDRAIIGVVLSPEPRGPRVDAMTPDSPAERAGLRTGDLITHINGDALASKKPDEALGKAREWLGNLKDGQEVRVAYLRDGQAGAELVLKAQRREALSWPRLFTDVDVDIDGDFDGRVAVDEDARVDAQRAQGDAGHARVAVQRAAVDGQRAMQHAEIARIDAERHAMPWWGISLAALNSELGRYFGSDSGVLVLSASKDSLPDLEAGDIIQKVGGRVVTRPEHVLRALRDEPTGRMLTLDVLRNRKALVLQVKVPEYKSIFSVGRLPPMPPLPPAPPVAPTVPAAPPALADPPSVPAPPSAPAPADAQAHLHAVSAASDKPLETVSVAVAKKGGSSGAPALWGGEILDRKMRSGHSCVRVASITLDAQGTPKGALNREGRNFLACSTETLDAVKFRTGAFATFAGHVIATRMKSEMDMPVLLVSDARAWKPMPAAFTPLAPNGYPRRP